ncbi:MAG: hypothetical protein E7370_01495 [Clostridiales bacterium]|nr:hypothetical protein [Clostridiales bacterium]
MVIIKLCCVATITAVCAFILKNNKSELVPLCIAAGGIILILSAFDYLSESIEFIKNFSTASGIDNSIIKLILKIVGIGYIIELSASSIKDLGFSGIADKLLLCGKLLIFIVSIPIFNNLYKIIVSLINLS